MKFSIN